MIKIGSGIIWLLCTFETRPNICFQFSCIWGHKSASEDLHTEETSENILCNFILVPLNEKRGSFFLRNKGQACIVVYERIPFQPAYHCKHPGIFWEEYSDQPTSGDKTLGLNGFLQESHTVICMVSLFSRWECVYLCIHSYLFCALQGGS